MQIGLVRRGWSSSGGAEAYLRRLAKALVLAGHQVRLFASDWPAEDWCYGEIVRLNGSSPAAFATDFAVNPTVEAYRSQGALFFSMERVPGCDVFRAGDGVHAAWLERRRLFEHPWRGWFRNWNRKHHELLSLEKRVFSPENTRFVIANSDLVAKEITAYYSYPSEQITIIPNGYTSPNFPPPSQEERFSLRKKYGIPPDHFVALFVGSGWERKGLDWAVRATKKIPGITLVVIGKGKQSSRYIGSHVCHLGTQSKVSTFYPLADALLQPTWYDPFSNACLEGLAAGLPVITTRDNGFSEILEEGVTGSILSRADAEHEILSALRFWQTANPEISSAYCKKAASSLTPQKNAEATIRILEKLNSPACSSDAG